jgi:hypothetical protein
MKSYGDRPLELSPADPTCSDFIHGLSERTKLQPDHLRRYRQLEFRMNSASLLAPSKHINRVYSATGQTRTD